MQFDNLRRAGVISAALWLGSGCGSADTAFFSQADGGLAPPAGTGGAQPGGGSAGVGGTRGAGGAGRAGSGGRRDGEGGLSSGSGGLTRSGGAPGSFDGGAAGSGMGGTTGSGGQHTDASAGFAGVLGSGGSASDGGSAKGGAPNGGANGSGGAATDGAIGSGGADGGPETGATGSGGAGTGGVSTGGAGDGGAVCKTNTDCATDFCQKPVGACSTNGSCESRPGVCPSTIDPVCSCSGSTYDNACLAWAAGVNIASRGACQQSCGLNPTKGCCFVDSDCNGGDRCVGSVCTAGGDGVCKPVKVAAGECWADADCPLGELCSGVRICSCGAACLLPDQAGTCTAMSAPSP